MLAILLILLLFLVARGESPHPIELREELGLHADVLRGAPQAFCYKARDEFNLAAIFDQVSIIVKSDESFNWHAVRGISSDDFHSVLQKFLFGFFLSEGEKQHLHERLSSDAIVFEKVSWIRDLVSSCPSPLGSMYPFNKCIMRFSPYGRACITVSVDHSVELEIDTIVGFNIHLLLHLTCGISLLIFAYTLSKSKIFQVSCSHDMKSHLLTYVIVVLQWFDYFHPGGYSSRRLFCRKSTYHPKERRLERRHYFSHWRVRLGTPVLY